MVGDGLRHLGGFVIDRRWPEVLVSQDGRNDLYGTDELRRQADNFIELDDLRVDIAREPALRVSAGDAQSLRIPEE